MPGFLNQSCILERLLDGASLTFGGGGHGRPGKSGRPALKLQAVFDVRRQVVIEDGIPDRKDLPVQVQRQGVIPRPHRVPESDAQGRDGREDGGDRPVRP